MSTFIRSTAIVTYKKSVAAEGTDGSASDDAVMLFDVLNVQLEDGSEFSAREAFMTNQQVTTQQSVSSLGSKAILPGILGVVIGGMASFFVMRIIRNRPFYVHKLALDHANQNEMAKALMGHPIKSKSKDYVGTLTTEQANYTIACQGPRGEGTLIVKAFKDGADETTAHDKDALLTPGSAWRFSTLVLNVKRNEKRQEKDKSAKTINLLANQSK
ncbi:TPA: hypothetical protein N0F65_009923 [Lagenidium giganteum]|uniref:Cytochrome oxidase complex assembly protein 1 n=1 Tax=Lagenidium giganteum TaxID=4803 RepID=A0AAV2YHH9_9STRA|nr:TPA: hypothetical protein N0F65_009720 [Lagenidium giganteum]DAZ93575.1 TPA: hypothetical protein N0F65_009923 [Lagenidium giganteum]